MAKKRKKKKQLTNKEIITGFVALLLCFYLGYYQLNDNTVNNNVSYAVNEIPEYNGKDFIYINNNEPSFTESDYKNESYQIFSELDNLGRCGPAIANIGIDLMPTKERESIGMIKPSGWHTIKYDNVDGKYLYNRCHLIGYQLTGENANPKNLITCTRQMNTGVMLEYENKVAKYIKETKNHVLYRVTPLFLNDNLVASGVLMEAKSVEDNGKGLTYSIYVYNVQNGITIDYLTGKSQLNE